MTSPIQPTPSVPHPKIESKQTRDHVAAAALVLTLTQTLNQANLPPLQGKGS